MWAEFIPDGSAIGENKITISLVSNGVTCEKTFTLDIIDRNLPKQTLLYTNWFHNDCLCTYYGVEVFSDEYWEIVDKYIKNAVEHGMNMILTPVFTPPLDTAVGGERPTVQLVSVVKEANRYHFDFTNFEKYVNLCLKNGAEAFEISHLFTQWGAEAYSKIVAQVNSVEEKSSAGLHRQAVKNTLHLLSNLQKRLTKKF